MADAEEKVEEQKTPEEEEAAALEGQIDALADGPDLFDQEDEEAPSDDATPADLKAEEGEPKEEGDGPPEETPEPKEETPEPKEEAKQDDDPEIPDLAEGESPKAEQFKNLREIAARFKKERNELREQKAALEQAAAQPAPVAPVAPAMPSQPAMSAGQVMDLLAKARNRDLDESRLNGQTNQDIERSARIAMQVFEPQQLLEVLDAAKEGRFGAYNDDVMEEARALLTEATVRQSVKGVEPGTRPAPSLPPAMMSQRQNSLGRLYARYPDLKNPESDLVKKIQAKIPEFQARTLGTPDKPGPDHWRIQSDPNLPEWQIEQLMKEIDAEKPVLSEAEARLSAENEELKKKLNRSRQPANTSGAPGSGAESPSGTGDSLEELEKQIDALDREAARNRF